MTLKEIILIIVVIGSFIIHFNTMARLNEMQFNEKQKGYLRLVSMLIPIAGYFLVRKKYKTLNK